MLVYLYGKYNEFMSYLYFITKLIILEGFIYTLLELILIHHISILKSFTQCIEIA